MAKSPSAKAVPMQLLGGAVMWFIWLRVCFLAGTIVMGLVLYYAGLLPAKNGTLSGLTLATNYAVGILVWTLIGLLGGWLGAVAAANMRLEVPT